MRPRLGKAVDGVVVVLCLPFYAVAVPLILLGQWLRQRRPVRVGLERMHWEGPDIRVDVRIVDVSRVPEGLVGVQQRRWDARRSQGGGGAPAYPDAVVYITPREFWVPRPLVRWRAWPHL